MEDATSEPLTLLELLALTLGCATQLAASIMWVRELL
jgi:hypothetical protein